MTVMSVSHAILKCDLRKWLGLCGACVVLISSDSRHCVIFDEQTCKLVDVPLSIHVRSHIFFPVTGYVVAGNKAMPT
jgi:hypothetical protein